jgi:hypothetical protein
MLVPAPARHTRASSACRAKPTCRLAFRGAACRPFYLAHPIGAPLLTGFLMPFSYWHRRLQVENARMRAHAKCTRAHHRLHADDAQCAARPASGSCVRVVECRCAGHNSALFEGLDLPLRKPLGWQRDWPSRRTSPSVGRGLGTSTRAWSACAATGKISSFLSSMVCNNSLQFTSERLDLRGWLSGWGRSAAQNAARFQRVLHVGAKLSARRNGGEPPFRLQSGDTVGAWLDAASTRERGGLGACADAWSAQVRRRRCAAAVHVRAHGIA